MLPYYCCSILVSLRDDFSAGPGHPLSRAQCPRLVLCFMRICQCDGPFCNISYRAIHTVLRWHVCRANLARTIFLSYELSLQKCFEISPKCLCLYPVDENKSRKIPSKFPQNFPVNQKNHQRASAGARGEHCKIPLPRKQARTLFAILSPRGSRLVTCIAAGPPSTRLLSQLI